MEPRDPEAGNLLFLVTFYSNRTFWLGETDSIAIKVVSGIEATEEDVSENPGTLTTSKIGYKGRVTQEAGNQLNVLWW